MTNDIDYTKGFDEEMVSDSQEKASGKVLEFEPASKPKRAPYAGWVVNHTEYKLKLTALDISKLEQRYRRNLLVYLTEDGLPAVSDMLTVIQAAMRFYHHGMTFLRVQELYDAYVAEGGDQTKLMGEVLMPLLSVSGFFTETQAEALAQEMQNLDTSI